MTPITVTKATRLELRTEKILESIKFAAGTDLSKVDIDNLYQEIVSNLYDGISTDEILDLSIKTAETKVTEHYHYSYLASRLILQKLYKEVFGESVYEYEDFYSKRYVAYFDQYLEKGIASGLLDPKLRDYDLQKIKAAIKPKLDLSYKESGMGRIYRQYLLKTNTDPQKVIELPQFWLMRVAMGICYNEENKEQRAIEYYNALSNLEVISATPTLLNSGRVRNQLSSCFLLTTQDSLEHIYKTYSDIAFLSKYAGGIGVDFNQVRATGSLIKGTNGKSLGLIPFLKVLDSSTAAVNQGGVRKGAVAVYIEPWHKDVFDFIASKYVSVEENRRCPNIHTVLWMPDLFFKRLEQNAHWTLFSPSEVPDLHDLYGKDFEKRYEEYEKDTNLKKEIIPVRKLWEEILTSLLGKGFGHPWITFKDTGNAGNSDDHTGVVHSSNLCTEIMLPTNSQETAVCNLAHLNLLKFVTDDKQVDWERLEKATRLLVRMLDNVIDLNFYSTKEAKNSNQKHRPIGMGTFGLQSMLEKLEIPLESQEATDFNDKLYEFISYQAIDESSNLAEKRGTYPAYKGSKWSRGILPRQALWDYIKERGVETTTDFATESLDWDSLRTKILNTGMRNSQVMSIAPNRSTSYIAGSSPSIEPWDSNIFTEVGMTGKYQIINENLINSLEKVGLWKPQIIEQIKIYDGSIQYISEIPEDIRNLYKTAWEVHPKWIIAQNARRQKWVDMSISFNMWLPNNNGKDAERLYLECWKAGLKATYYLHSKSKTQAQKIGIKVNTGSQTIDLETNNGEAENPGQINSEIDNSLNGPAAKMTSLKPGQVCDMTDPDCEACQ